LVADDLQLALFQKDIAKRRAASRMSATKGLDVFLREPILFTAGRTDKAKCLLLDASDAYVEVVTAFAGETKDYVVFFSHGLHVFPTVPQFKRALFMQTVLVVQIDCFKNPSNEGIGAKMYVK